MIDLHEEETVTFGADRSRPCSELWALLKNICFTLEEDVFVYLRTEKDVAPWQHDAVIEIEILAGDDEVFSRSGKWDTLNVIYPLGRVPMSEMPLVVQKAAEIAQHLALPMVQRGSVVNSDELTERLNEYAAELTDTAGAPGSEELAILIESRYPR